MKVSRLFFLVVGVLLIAGPAMAAEPLRAVPFEFIGKAGDCGATSPAGSHIVTSAWLGGIGLPDNGGANTTPADEATPAGNPYKNDPHRGLLLSKNGPTADCSSAGATITGVKGMTVPAGFELGFDYRNGGHCGAGSPRYNVVVTPPSGPNTFHFVGGCANGTKTPAPQDTVEWTRVRFNTSIPAQSSPVIPPGSTIVSINLLVDEGTDSTSTPDDPSGVGLSVVDNLDINGTLITTGRGIADDTGGEGNGTGPNE